MYDHNTNAADAVSRRSVLRTAGGLLAGGTAILAGGRRGTATPDRHGPVRADLRERNEEYIAVEMWFPRDVFDAVEFPQDIFLGDADQFVIHDGGTPSRCPKTGRGSPTPTRSKTSAPRGPCRGH